MATKILKLVQVVAAAFLVTSGILGLVSTTSGSQQGFCSWESGASSATSAGCESGQDSAEMAASRKSVVDGPHPGWVAVVGGGLAGLSASIEVLRGGGSVIIIEKGERLGGNSAKASSGMNAAQSGPQSQLGITDRVEDFLQDTIKSGKGLSTEELAALLAANSAEAVEFLEGLGIDLSTISQLGGHLHPRTHRSKPDGKPANIGWRIMSTLISFVESQPADKVRLLKATRALDFVVGSSGQVVGVRCEAKRKPEEEGGPDELVDLEVLVDAVVVTTGGYGADREGLLSTFTPDLRHLATTNGAFATGDGVKMGERIGAALVHMDQVQVHPTGFVDLKDPTNPTKFLAPEALRGSGGVLLNSQGQRFVNELSTRDAVTSAILSTCQPLPPSLAPTAAAAAEKGGNMPITCFLLLTEQGIEMFGKSTASFYTAKGLMRKFDSVQELSQEWNLPEAAVVATLEKYGKETADPFGKTVFPTLFNAHEAIWGALITPVLHYCMGGLGFDSQARILKPNGTPISGLYGAGEVTGGLHGANRLGGNSLLECVVFGRIAGRNALASAAPKLASL